MRWGCHDGIGVLTGRHLRELLALPPPLADAARRWPPARQRSLTRTQPCGRPDLGLPASRTVRKKCLVLKPPACGILLRQLREGRSRKRVVNRISVAGTSPSLSFLQHSRYCF